MNYRHGGNLRDLAQAAGRRPEEIVDFSASINPLGPPESLRQVISSNVSSLVHYPDPYAAELAEALAEKLSVDPDEVVVGNGSTELLYLLPRAITATRAVIPVPSYVDYAVAAELAGIEVRHIPLQESNGFRLGFSELSAHLDGDEIVFLGQPNNPTGLLFDTGELRRLASEKSETVFVIDEAFADFVDGYHSLIERLPPNVVVLRSLTKFYAIPGLRLGFAVAGSEIAARIRRLIPPWSVNTLAQAVGLAVIQEEEYAVATRETVRLQRERLVTALGAVPDLTVFPGAANFLLLRIDRPQFDAPPLAEKLLHDGIAIRVWDNFAGLDRRFFRIAVHTAEENDRLVRAVRAAFGEPAPQHIRRRTPAIMFQGTSSNAGKSILTAGMCRVLLQDGYRVAPFKAQNMSLNSFVTRHGEEMGRAQVVQAQACRLDADVRMNPVLLKPCSDTGSQVILQGHPVGNMKVGTYLQFKQKAFAAVKDAYDSLAAEHEVIVLEGAGSPAEVNLKRDEIVNMHIAQYAGASVLIVGDIDRGGVFASFIGTMEVMAEWERELVAGFVVNRFRGEQSLLGDALDYTAKHTGRPVLGVVPYLHDLGLPEEDSVEFKDGRFGGPPAREDAIEIAVIDLPHISNFTDFDPLRIEPDVHLTIARTPRDLVRPDAVILPGSKNVIDDLEFLRQSGLADRIADLASKGGTEIIGVCGGFQMLGEEISDPCGIESAGGAVPGLRLLPVATVLALEKTLLRACGIHADSGLAVRGYEIHHGKTALKSSAPAMRRDDGEMIGAQDPQRSVWGTYLHGLFDADEFRRWWIDRLRARRGLDPLGEVCATYDLEPAFDRLADVLRASLKMDEIYRLLRLQ